MYSEERWEYLGKIGVDSGSMLLSDPCYVKDFPPFDDTTWKKDLAANAKEYTYNSAGAASCSEAQAAILGDGMGAVCSTGYGDGNYPVYVIRNRDGRIAAMMIDFDGVLDDPDDEEDEDDWEDDD